MPRPGPSLLWGRRVWAHERGAGVHSAPSTDLCWSLPPRGGGEAERRLTAVKELKMVLLGRLGGVFGLGSNLIITGPNLGKSSQQRIRGGFSSFGPTSYSQVKNV